MKRKFLAVAIPPNAAVNERQKLESEDGKVLVTVERIFDERGIYTQVIVYYDEDTRR